MQVSKTVTSWEEDKEEDRTDCNQIGKFCFVCLFLFLSNCHHFLKEVEFNLFKLPFQNLTALNNCTKKTGDC